MVHLLSSWLVNEMPMRSKPDFYRQQKIIFEATIDGFSGGKTDSRMPWAQCSVLENSVSADPIWCRAMLLHPIHKSSGGNAHVGSATPRHQNS
jgi:hypothetical protein